jgi:hypothetical protein
MGKNIDVHLNEKREAEYFGDRFFFGIQAVGQLYLWSLNLHSPIFLGLGMGMAFQFLQSCRIYSRLRTGGNRLMFFNEDGLTHFALSLQGPVQIPWENVSAMESRKYLNTLALRLHFTPAKNASHGNRRFLDIPMDLLGKSPHLFAETLCEFPRAGHLRMQPAETQESTAQAA